jgi:hypothetical protein
MFGYSLPLWSDPIAFTGQFGFRVATLLRDTDWRALQVTVKKSCRPSMSRCIIRSARLGFCLCSALISKELQKRLGALEELVLHLDRRLGRSGNIFDSRDNITKSRACPTTALAVRTLITTSVAANERINLVHANMLLL